MLLMFAAGTTAVNRTMQALAKQHPQLTRIAAIVNGFSVDLWIVIREVGSFFGKPTEASIVVAAAKEEKKLQSSRPPPPPFDPPSPPASGPGMAAIIMVIVLLYGCSLFTPKNVLTALEEAARLLCVGAKAQQVGVSPEEIRDTACQTRPEWEPFLDAARAAQRAGAIKAGMAPAPLTPENAEPLKSVPELEERK